MIKRTVYIGNPAYLSASAKQLLVARPGEEGKTLPPAQIPVEDIGVVILDNNQITVSHHCLNELLQNNVAVVTCDEKHMPAGLFMPLEANEVQSQRFTEQIAASEPLKKQLWQQTVSCKVHNQAILLSRVGKPAGSLRKWSKEVQSGDATNLEGRAAVYYWKHLFPEVLCFRRDRAGEPPNQLLNYGYAILRGVIARALAGSGLLPTFGIHHRNKYNAYCLADDIMEPYRPYVDALVLAMVLDGEDFTELTPSIKKQLLNIPVVTVHLNGRESPLMVAAQLTTASLAKCFSGGQRKLLYPVMQA